ncbi:uncharacterized protein LOC129942716 [Eupeodes corollae]|uniref:uncharacterized protein LOC129942716 n=1 Tax=Eupeodes corollae TaxID=290404 RepID=UPI0024927B95|nr:uncharacterized protein LOC129942716 [Eupeodes corollae]
MFLFNQKNLPYQLYQMKQKWKQNHHDYQLRVIRILQQRNPIQKLRPPRHQQKQKLQTTYQTELPTSSTVKSEVASDLKEECIRKTVGNFADPDDCHYYYRCMKGVLNRQECPRGFGWDAKSKMCSTKGCLK